jgi:RNA ligase (TIGR02306 family)
MEKNSSPLIIEGQECDQIIAAATPDRALATIRVVGALRPIPDADLIEVAEVDGWQVVVKKGEFKVGDLGIFYEIDSFLPERPEYEFLRKSCYRTNYDGTKGFRLKTIRLRGQLSQGLLLPVGSLENFPGGTYREGDDVTVELSITKWEKPIPAHLTGRCKGNFPTHIVPKTDEPRIQNLPRSRVAMKQATGWYVREKLDGSSLTFFLHKGEFGVCSRNIWLTETEDNAYWQVLRDNDIEGKLRDVFDDIAIQGELCGPGIQGNRYKLLMPTVYLFSVYDVVEQKYLSDRALVGIGEILELPVAPLYNVFQELPETTAEILEFSNRKSLVCPEVDAEGCVWRSYDIYGHRQHSFKAISNAYLLSEKD